MQCTECLRIVPDGPVTCPHCGAALARSDTPASNVAHLIAPTAVPPPSPSLSRLGMLLLIVGSVVCWLFVLLLAFARTLRWSGGSITSRSQGYFVGTFLTPVLLSAFIIWLINQFAKNKMSLAVKQGAAASLALGLSILAFIGSPKEAPGSEQAALRKQIGHLVKQASCQEATPAHSEWYEGPAREFYRELMDSRKQYQEALQVLDRSSVQTLYTPDSYATRSRLQTTISQVQAVLDLDKKYESVEPAIRNLEKNIAASSTSDAQKAEFLQGFRTSAGKSFAPRAETFRTEEEWLLSTITLYQFALSHKDSYTVKNKKLVFRDTELLSQFSDLQSKSIALRLTAGETRQKFEAAQKDAAAQMGVTQPTPSTK